MTGIAGRLSRDRHADAHDASGTDTRYRRLVGELEWQRLPAAVRSRFERRLAPGEVKIYRGEVVQTALTGVGWLLAQVARLVGAPLPLGQDVSGTSVVTVMEAPAMSGQIWSRSYARAGTFPQVIHSAKRFTGPTGLEEYVGCGIVMRLRVSVEQGMLVFRSAGYALEIAGRALPLPRWLSPGECVVCHRDDGGGRFTFTLALDHPLAGRLVHQEARYCDEPTTYS